MIIKIIFIDKKFIDIKIKLLKVNIVCHILIFYLQFLHTLKWLNAN